MTSILRMAGLLHLRRGNPNEDVVQGRPGQFKVPYFAMRHERSQELLRVGPSLQADLLPAAKIGNLLYARQAFQWRTVAFQPDTDRIAPVGILNRIQGAVEHFPALVNHKDEVA